MPNHRSSQDSGWAGADVGEQGMFAQIIDQIARLLEENDDLRCRVRRLESHSGRGIVHPSEFSHGLKQRPA